MKDTNCNELLADNLNFLSSKIEKITNPPERVIIGNKDLSKLLGVSTRTLQEWRDKGIIGFSKVGKSIFYTLSDVLSMLDKNYTRPFA